MGSYILMEFPLRKFTYKYVHRDGEIKTWILADEGADIWRIKVVVWGAVTTKRQTVLLRGTVSTLYIYM